MARYYDFTFRLPDYGEVTTREQGNTRRSAERSSRRRLREIGHDPTQCRTVRVDHVPRPGSAA